MSWSATTILLAVSIATSVIATGTTAFGQYQRGQAQKKMNQYNVDVAAQQAMIEKRTADTNVTLVQDQAKEAAKQQRRNLAMLEGEQKGMLAAQGVGGGSVTEADIMESTLDTAELDREAIRYNADSRSWAIKEGANFGAWDLANQSNQYTMAGKNAARAGNIGATASLLQGASQVAGIGYGSTTKGQTSTQALQGNRFRPAGY